MATEKDMRHKKHCDLCGEKIGWMDKNFLHYLCDGTLCPKCNMTFYHLVSHRKWWVSDEEYKQALESGVNLREHESVPLEKARALLALRDTVGQQFLESVGLESGNVFVINQVFKMPPSPPIFILRSLKVRNKAVLQGFPLNGEVRKGDQVVLNIQGETRRFTALDVISAGTDSLKKEVFFSNLEANVHSHRFSTDREGWIIVDTEDVDSIPVPGFAATVGKK